MTILLQDDFLTGISSMWSQLLQYPTSDSITYNASESAARITIAPPGIVQSTKAFLEASSLPASGNGIKATINVRVSNLPILGTDIILTAFGGNTTNAPILCGLLHSSTGGGTLYWRIQIKNTAGALVGDYRAVAAYPVANFDLSKIYNLEFTVVEDAINGEVHLKVDGVEAIAQTGIKTDYGKELLPTPFPAVNTFNVGACFVGDRASAPIIDVFNAIVSDFETPTYNLTLASSATNLLVGEQFTLTATLTDTLGTGITGASVQVDSTPMAELGNGVYGILVTALQPTTIQFQANEPNLNVFSNTVTVTTSCPIGTTWNGTQCIATPSHCFIATVAYGTPSAPQLNTLRRFRDKCLPKHMTNVYYALSPPFADKIRDKSEARTLIRGYIEIIVKTLKKLGV